MTDGNPAAPSGLYLGTAISGPVTTLGPSQGLQACCKEVALGECGFLLWLVNLGPTERNGFQSSLSGLLNALGSEMDGQERIPPVLRLLVIMSALCIPKQLHSF